MFPSYNLRNHVTEKVLLQKYGSFVKFSIEKEFHAARMKVSTFKKDDACQSYAFIWHTMYFRLSNYFAIAFKFVLGFIQKN